MAITYNQAKTSTGSIIGALFYWIIIAPIKLVVKLTIAIYVLALLFFTWAHAQDGLGYHPKDVVACHTYFVQPKPENRICYLDKRDGALRYYNKDVKPQ